MVHKLPTWQFVFGNVHLLTILITICTLVYLLLGLMEDFTWEGLRLDRNILLGFPSSSYLATSV
jgi:hypothetical protein